MKRHTLALVAAFAVCAGGPVAAQSARAAAPVDLTGYWVSVVTEDWPWRMHTPPQGDYASIPLNDEGRRVADLWTEGAGRLVPRVRSGRRAPHADTRTHHLG